MGVETDQEIFSLVGTEPQYVNGLMPSIQECKTIGIQTQVAPCRVDHHLVSFFVGKIIVSTQNQALVWLGNKIKVFRAKGPRRAKVPP